MSPDQVVGLVMMGVGLLDIFLAVGVLGPRIADPGHRRLVTGGLVLGGVVIGGAGTAFYSGALTMG